MFPSLHRSLAPAHRRLPALLLLASLLALTGCGGVKGTYVAQEKTPDGDSMSMTLELKGDSKASMTIKGGSGGTNVLSSEGTYSVSGDKITVILNGDPTVFTLAGGKLTTKFMDESLTFIKQ